MAHLVKSRCNMCSFQGDTQKWKDHHIWYILCKVKYLAGNLSLEYQLLWSFGNGKLGVWVYYFESMKWVFCASYTLSFNWKPFGPTTPHSNQRLNGVHTSLLPPLLTYWNWFFITFFPLMIPSLYLPDIPRFWWIFLRICLHLWLWMF